MQAGKQAKLHYNEGWMDCHSNPYSEPPQQSLFRATTNAFNFCINKEIMILIQYAEKYPVQVLVLEILLIFRN